MPYSFFQRIFGQKKSGSLGGSLSFGNETVKTPAAAGTPAGQSTKEDPERQTLGPDAQTSHRVKKVDSLFAFVDSMDPFTPGEIAGEELPGPILSILSARHFDSVSLFHTPQTRENAFDTEAEIARRHTACRVRLQQLPVSDPKNYSSLMDSLWRYGRDLLRRSESGDKYVCVSSGTAEMRAVWFVLTTLGIVRARLLQVGTPIHPLFGKVNVRELRLDSDDWLTNQQLAMRAEHFGWERMGSVREPPPDTALTLRGPRWPLFKGKRPKEAVPHEESKAGAETFEFDEAFVEWMRLLYGYPLTNLLSGLRRKFLSMGLPRDSVQALTAETLRGVADALRGAVPVRHREIDPDREIDMVSIHDFMDYKTVEPTPPSGRLWPKLRPEFFAAFVNSISNRILLEYYRASRTSPPTEDFELEAPPNVLNELKLTPDQLEILRQAMAHVDDTEFAAITAGEEPPREASAKAGEEVPAATAGEPESHEAQPAETEAAKLAEEDLHGTAAGEEIKESVSGDRRRLETPKPESEVLDAEVEDRPAAEEPPREEAPEQEKLFGKSRRHMLGSPLEGANPQTERAEIEPEKLPVPGLDDALQELGIHVGSAVLRHAAERAAIAADSHLPVLLLGETGTGKERFAHLIQRLSPRSGRDMVTVNCAAIPTPLAESYLFGHVKGAFSDATSDKEGIFESADHTTLFLDEIAELTLEVQAKLLRVIQDGIVQRLGNNKSRKVDVRIIAASNRDLRDQVRAGKFREDLYFRLEVVQIKLPALRERRCEIPELALALLRQINLRRRKPRQLTSAALMRLEKYHWPGNVRQLSNVLESSVLYARNDSIDADDLLITDDKPAKDPFAALPDPFPGFKLDTFLAQAREQLFLRALAACNGNQTEAAERLGVSRQAVNKFVAGQNDNYD